MSIKIYAEIRKLLGFTMQDIANEMGCTKQTISNIENSKAEGVMASRFYITTMNSIILKNEEKIKVVKTNLREILKFLDEA